MFLGYETFQRYPFHNYTQLPFHAEVDVRRIPPGRREQLSLHGLEPSNGRNNFTQLRSSTQPGAQSTLVHARNEQQYTQGFQTANYHGFHSSHQAEPISSQYTSPILQNNIKIEENLETRQKKKRLGTTQQSSTTIKNSVTQGENNTIKHESEVEGKPHEIIDLR